jgi:hypothetical protein
LSERFHLVGVSQRERRLIWATQLCPLFRRLQVFPGDLRRERATQFQQRDLVTNAGTSAPGEELAEPPCRLSTDGEFECSVGCLHDLVWASRQPGGLGPRHGDRADPRELSGRLGERPRLVEQRVNLGITPAGSDERQDGERENARCRRGAGHAQHSLSAACHILPAAGVERDAGRVREEIEPVELQAVVAAVLEAPRRDDAR